MRSPLVGPACVAALSAMALGAAAQPSTFKPPTPFKAERAEAFTPVSAAPKDAPILPAGTPGAATALDWYAVCSAADPGKGVVSLRWKLAAGSGGAQRVEVTGLREGFQSGKYQATRALPREQLSAALERPEPGISYYWRVVTLTGAGWVQSEVHRFDAPTCPVDGVDPGSAG